MNARSSLVRSSSVMPYTQIVIRSIEFTTWYGKPEVKRTAAFSDCSSVSTSARYQGSYSGPPEAHLRHRRRAAAAAAASAKASTFAIDESVDVGAVRWAARRSGRGPAWPYLRLHSSSWSRCANSGHRIATMVTIAWYHGRFTSPWMPRNMPSASTSQHITLRQPTRAPLYRLNREAAARTLLADGERTLSALLASSPPCLTNNLSGAAAVLCERREAGVSDQTLAVRDQCEEPDRSNWLASRLPQRLPRCAGDSSGNTIGSTGPCAHWPPFRERASSSFGHVPRRSTRWTSRRTGCPRWCRPARWSACKAPAGSTFARCAQRCSILARADARRGPMDAARLVVSVPPAARPRAARRRLGVRGAGGAQIAAG